MVGKISFETMTFLCACVRVRVCVRVCVRARACVCVCARARVYASGKITVVSAVVSRPRRIT